MSRGFTRRLNPWYISIPSNPNLYSTKIIIKMRCKQLQAMFNTHYQPHNHPTTKSLWLCSSVYCRPPHQSRRIWLVAAATNQKQSLALSSFCEGNQLVTGHSQNVSNMIKDSRFKIALLLPLRHSIQYSHINIWNHRFILSTSTKIDHVKTSQHCTSVSKLLKVLMSFVGKLHTKHNGSSWD